MSSNPQGLCKILGMAVSACDPGTAGWKQLDPSSSVPRKPGPNKKFSVQEEDLSQSSKKTGRKKKNTQSLPLYIHVDITPP